MEAEGKELGSETAPLSSPCTRRAIGSPQAVARVLRAGRPSRLITYMYPFHCWGSWVSFS